MLSHARISTSLKDSSNSDIGIRRHGKKHLRLSSRESTEHVESSVGLGNRESRVRGPGLTSQAKSSQVQSISDTEDELLFEAQGKPCRH